MDIKHDYSNIHIPAFSMGTLVYLLWLLLNIQNFPINVHHNAMDMCIRVVATRFLCENLKLLVCFCFLGYQCQLIWFESVEEMATKPLEEMTCSDVVDWLSSGKRQKFS